MKQIKLNSDVGEGVVTEATLIPFLSYANIACGGHYGDEQSMKDTLELTMKYGVIAGAHPSYPDKENFGRKSLEMDPSEISKSCAQQISTIQKVAQKLGTTIHFVKPHGALNNDMCLNNDYLIAVCEALKMTHYQKLMIPLTDRMEEIKKITDRFSLNVLWEVFADRAYEDDGTLRSRKKLGAVHQDTKLIIKQVEDIITKQGIQTSHSFFKTTKADTICLHGDNPSSVNAAQTIQQLLH